MNRYERAAQIWSVLALAARNRQVLTYETVGRLIGVPQFGLGTHLEPIQSYCLTNHLPPLTALVVAEASGLPGGGFIAAKEREIPRAQAEAFAFDWLEHGAPSPETLEQAARQCPSNGVIAAKEASGEFGCASTPKSRNP